VPSSSELFAKPFEFDSRFIPTFEVCCIEFACSIAIESMTRIAGASATNRAWHVGVNDAETFPVISPV
jgi:hypothetical protein